MPGRLRQKNSLGECQACGQWPSEEQQFTAVCPSNTVPPVTITNPPGAFYADTIENANEFSLEDAEERARAALTGCPDPSNTQQQFTAECPEDFTGPDVTVVIPAGRYFAVDVPTANANALAAAEYRAELHLECTPEENPGFVIEYYVPADDEFLPLVEGETNEIGFVLGDDGLLVELRIRSTQDATLTGILFEFVDGVQLVLDDIQSDPPFNLTAGATWNFDLLKTSGGLNGVGTIEVGGPINGSYPVLVARIEA